MHDDKCSACLHALAHYRGRQSIVRVLQIYGQLTRGDPSAWCWPKNDSVQQQTCKEALELTINCRYAVNTETNLKDVGGSYVTVIIIAKQGLMADCS
jgi:hypothetical protein